MAHVLMIMNGNGIGGAELQFLELANHLNRNHDVTLVCLQGSSCVQACKPSPRIRLEEFPYSAGKRSAAQLIRAIRFCRNLKPDAIITTAFVGDLVGSLSKISSAQKLVSLQTVSAKMPYDFAHKMLLSRFDFLVAGCRDIENFLVSHGRQSDKIRVINNWVDFSSRELTKSVSDVRAAYGLKDAGIVIGCIGRMHHQKGQEYLIRAFKKLSVKRSDVTLVLVGDGPLKNEMMEEAEGNAAIVFTGTITGDNYTNLLNAFDIYVQPSRYEGLPRTLLDAMYLGLPIVASAANGMRDIICSGQNGWLVPTEDPDAILGAVEHILHNPEAAEAAGAKAASDARQNYSMSLQTSKIEALLEQ